jgi:hypothetical protein
MPRLLRIGYIKNTRQKYADVIQWQVKSLVALPIKIPSVWWFIFPSRPIATLWRPFFRCRHPKTLPPPPPILLPLIVKAVSTASSSRLSICSYSSSTQPPPSWGTQSLNTNYGNSGIGYYFKFSELVRIKHCMYISDKYIYIHTVVSIEF